MSTAPILPQTFWFRMAFACPRVSPLPRADAKGRLLDLPDSCRLPDLAQLDGKAGWADVRVAWDESGLGVSVEATGRVGAPADDRDAGQSPGFHVWVDTRDTRDVHRATRFCHRFAATLAPNALTGLKVEQKPIARALADAPTARAGVLRGRGERTRKGWLAEVFLPAEALHGFDPDTNRRLGFMLQAIDPAQPDQFLLGIGREFPVGEDPSLWGTLELGG